jgi:hypothetical protein
MTDLATPEDLAARLGRYLTDVEATRAGALLTDASAMVRAYTGQDFTTATDQATLRGQGGTIRLPQRPVTAVTSVIAIGGDGAPDVTVIDWIWDGLDQIRVGEGSFVINLPAVWWDDDGYPGTYRVTYTHGYADVPADVVAVVCGMVLRTLTAPTMAGGVRSETIGPYSYQLDVAGTGVAVMMSQADRDALKRYRQTLGMISVRRG